VLVDVLVTAKVRVPVTFGVPERTPAEESDIPLNRLPLAFAKVYWLVLPLAVSVALEAVLFFPFDRVDGLTVIVGQS
jgi:hypothetical protein